MKPANIDLHIDELVLNGFELRDCRRITGALERELQRLFLANGPALTITCDNEIARVQGGEFEMKPGASAESTGIQLANLIYGIYGGFANEGSDTDRD